eukprot:gene7184-291_t
MAGPSTVMNKAKSGNKSISGGRKRWEILAGWQGKHNNENKDSTANTARNQQRVPQTSATSKQSSTGDKSATSLCSAAIDGNWSGWQGKTTIETTTVLRYVGVVDVTSGTGSVELRRYPKSHPFAGLAGSDNIISFTTKRYAKQPLVVRGPGAGAEVTAGGVFADLLRLAAYLGAPS